MTLGGRSKPSRLGQIASPLGLLVVQSRVQANKRSTVGANIVLIGAKLATLGGDSLEFFLSWGIGVTNVHWKPFFADANAVELANDFVANIPRIKSRLCQKERIAEDEV